MKYSDYLDTKHWKEVRTKIRRRARGWCERCHIRPRADIHHLNYECLGNESKNDVVAVCHYCHEFLHGIRIWDPAAIAFSKDEIKVLREIHFWNSIGIMDLAFLRHPEWSVILQKKIDSERRK